jgi:hypothetical protein
MMMNTQSSKTSLFPGLVLILALTSGCPLAHLPQTQAWIEKWSPKAVVKKVVPSGKSELKKRIILLPLADRIGRGADRSAQLTEGLKSRLETSPRFLIHDPPASIALPEGELSPESGIVNHPELLKRAAYFGADVLITGVFNRVEITTKRKGIWPFRKYRRVYDVSSNIFVVDVHTKTFLLNSTKKEQVDFPYDEEEEEGGAPQDKEAYLDDALKEALPELLEEQAEAVVDRLLTEPWTGRILSVETESMTINGGRAVGIEPGQAFMVYAKGETIRCAGGKELEMFGNPVGEIKVTSVTEDRATAVPKDEGAFLAGQVVRELY